MRGKNAPRKGRPFIWLQLALASGQQKELLEAAGLRHTGELTAHHIVRRINDTEVRLLSNLVLHVKEGSLLTDLDSQHQVFKLYWPLASAHSFAVSKPKDKVSSTGEEEPAAEVVPA